MFGSKGRRGGDGRSFGDEDGNTNLKPWMDEELLFLAIETRGGKRDELDAVRPPKYEEP